MKINLQAAAFGLALAAGLGAAPAARAQIDMGAGPPVMDWIGPQIQAERAGELYRSLSGARDTRLSVSYTVTPELQAATIQNYVARHRATDPATARSVEALAAKGELTYDKGYKGLTARYNLYENDAADALAAYLLLGYRIVRNVPAAQAPTVDQEHALRSQVFDLLAKTSIVKDPNAPGRLGEALKLEYVLLQADWKMAQAQGTLPAFRQKTAAAFLSGYQVDFARLKLTVKGFARILS